MAATPTQLSSLLQETIVSFDTDLVAESIAMGLEQHGVAASDIFMRPVGTHARGYRKDVSAYSIQEDASGERNLLFLHVNREGIYDGLPEFIFHHSRVESSHRKIRGITDEMKRFREEEAAARLFFLPFEQEFFEAGRTLQRLELNLDVTHPKLALVDLFATHWPILKRLTKEAGYIFLTMLPNIASMRNDLALTAKKISHLLRVDVKIILVPSIYTSVMYDAPPLGIGSLGVDTIIGTAVCDGESDVAVHILFDDNSNNLIDKDNTFRPMIEDFLPGGCMCGIVEELCGYFIGAEYGISVQYECAREKDDLQLNDSVILGMGMLI